MTLTASKDLSPKPSAALAWLSYSFVILFCLGLESLLLGLGWTDLGIPYQYHYDFLYNSLLVKGLVEHGWVLNNPNLGAPGALAMHDYPEVTNLNFLLVKCIALFTDDWAKVINLFYVVSFPLAAVAALFVFRHFSVSAPVAVTGSLLFAFAPYHFLRMHHLVYINYCFIPLITLVLLWIMNGERLIVYREGAGGRWRFNFRSGRALGCVGIALLVSGSVIYYSFFSCFFLLVAGVVAYWNRRDAGALFTSWILIGVISASVAVQMIPTWMYQAQHGENPLIVLRPAKESEEYGLKIAQLLLPVERHRVEWMAQLRARYDRTAPLTNENSFSSLGVAGSVGFLVLLAALLRRRGGAEEGEGLIFNLAGLNLAAVLLGTVGGFSSLFAYVINPQLRAYNRISIFIEFFAVFAFVLVLARVLQKISEKQRFTLAGYGLCAAVLVVGVLDQTPTTFKTPYPVIKQRFEKDASFFQGVEHNLPSGARVFQLPFVGFPINKGPSRMIPYDHARGYLHTRNVRWSYGAITGRDTDLWQQTVSLLPVPAMVDVLARAGFEGLYLDRLGYEDDGRELVGKLARILGEGPRLSEDGRKVFFSLAAYTVKKRSGTSSEQWNRLQKAVLENPLTLAGEQLYQPSQVLDPPAGVVEIVRSSSGASKGGVLVGGWAIDPDTLTPATQLMVVHQGKASQLFVSQQVPRPDIANRYGTASVLKSQWSAVLDTRMWEPGEQSFEIYAVLAGERLARLEGCDKRCRVTVSHR